jgi:dTDP-4-dehydrorhamnose reductase
MGQDHGGDNVTRVGVLGAAGMLGHKILQTLSSEGVDVFGTVKTGELEAGEDVAFISDLAPLRYGVDAQDFADVQAELDRSRPDVVVNCIGIVKQKPLAEDYVVSIKINSLLPHLLEQWCTANAAKLIHFSTDCVFSGDKGGYSEEDESDARDLYGRTKYLGEVAGSEAALTLRTSIIGRELSSFRSLVEWLYRQQSQQIVGFDRALYSGMTTLQASRVVATLIRRGIPISGLYQVAGPWISKYELLVEIRDTAGLNIEITRDIELVSDRTMVGKRFTKATGIVIPEWSEMIIDMVTDPTPYKGAR